jgi:membrane fusion protein (multidrug efflux system)
MFQRKVKLVMTAAAVVAALLAGAVALAQSGVGRPIVGPASLNQKAAKLSGTKSARSENDQEHRKIVLTSPKAMDVTIIQPYVCRIHGRRYINIRALANGNVVGVRVREGEAVKKGDLMFTIVPVPNGAKSDADSAHVIAPYDGIVGSLHEQVGSLIKEGDVLTTLSDNGVVWVYFNVPEQRYLEYMASRKQQHDENKVELVLANRTKFPQPGKLNAIAGEFNKETGNIAFRADFPNPDGLLRHGQSGTILMHRKVRNAIVIPLRATYEIMDKRYVYVVDKDDVVHRRAIVIQDETDDIYVIKNGVGVADRIVIEGIRQVRDGEKVKYEFRPPEEVMRKLTNHAK